MSHTVYSIELAYARMRELQDLADRSRAQHTAAAHRARLGRRRTAAAKKR